MRVKAKIDLWISILVWVTMAIIGISILIIPSEQRTIAYVIGIPALVFVAWIYFKTYYEFKEDYLYCRSGPFFERILYDKIKSLKLSQNMASSMALSRERIEIRQHDKNYVMGTTFISPENREAFLQELASRCNRLD